MRQRSTLTIVAILIFAVSPPAIAQSGVGVPEPPGIHLPATWTAHWCPQLRPQGEWIGHPDAIRAGWDWRLHCPSRGWQGWFAELFPCTEAAICLGWEADLFGTRATHNGNLRREHGRVVCNYSLRDFHIAEVYWDKSHPAYQLMYALNEFPCRASSTPAERDPILPGLKVLRLAGSAWVSDTVRTAGRQIVEFESGVRMTVGDEDQKWRRVTGEVPTPMPAPPTPTPPPPTPTPTPVPTPVPSCCPTGQVCSAPCPPQPTPCSSCPPVITLPPECAPIAALRETADVIARSPFTSQRRRQRNADCIRAIERVFAAPAVP